MDYTTNYNLKKPALTDFALITDIDENMDIIDAEIAKKQDEITGGASTIASDNLTASRALASNSSGKVVASTTTATELGYVHGVKSSIQDQLDALTRHVVSEGGTDLNDYKTGGWYFFGTAVAPENRPTGSNGILLVISGNVAETATTQCKQYWFRLGTPGTTSYQTFERMYMNGEWSSWIRFLTEKDVQGAVSTILTSMLTASRALVSNSSGAVGVSSTTATELGYVHGVTSPIQTQLDGKQATIDGAASSITGSNLTASRALISNSSGKVAASSTTSTELGYVHGVTSAIQTQLNGKQASISGAASTITSANLTASKALVSNTSGKVAVANATVTEVNYLSGVTSAIQTQLNSKQATITGAATTITGSNLTASRALVSNSSGKVAVSAVTSTELGYLDGVTGNVQTQINNAKVTLHSNHAAGITDVSISGATDTAAGSFTLAAGTWMITVGAYWDDTNNTQFPGHRSVWLSNSSTASIGDAQILASSAIPANDTGYSTRQQFTTFVTVSASTTFYIRVRQYTRGISTVKCSTRYSVVKLSS